VAFWGFIPVVTFFNQLKMDLSCDFSGKSVFGTNSAIRTCRLSHSIELEKDWMLLPKRWIHLRVDCACLNY